MRGQTYSMVTQNTRAPALLRPGDTVCLAVQTDRFTGRITALQAFDRTCPIAPNPSQAPTGPQLAQL